MEDQRLMTVFDITAAALQENSFKGAATVAVTELATRLNCDRVSIGFVKNDQAIVEAVSHSAHLERQMNLTRAIGEAMDESLDQNATLISPPQSEKNDSILRSHSELARLHGSGSNMTVPFLDENGDGYGAITFERAEDLPFNKETVELCEAVAAIVGPAINEKRLNDRPLYTKAVDSIKYQLNKILGPGHPVAKFFVGCFVVLLIFFTFAKGEYRVTARTSLEGTVQRSVIAPFDGYIFESLLRAGDIVEKDQAMASFDTRDLMLERIEWASKKQQHTLEFDKALANNEIAQSKIVQELIKQAESKLSLLEEQFSRATIKAPFKGLIISGDLSQSIGAPVERGQVLFEIAPLNSYRIMLEVDERDIGEVIPNQEGELVLNSLPESTYPFVVEKMTPVSTAQEGRNFFLVEGRLTGDSESLRPGMLGYGKIVIERRRLIWIWTHELFDWMRLWLWSVIP